MDLILEDQEKSVDGIPHPDTATHIVDRVLPIALIRQLVLSLHFALRYRLGYDSGLVIR
jgi:hypothetical protein